MSIVNIAAYKFVTLTNLETRRTDLRKLCSAAKLRGTILLAGEGINLFVAGHRESVARLLEALQSDDEIGPLEVKESLTDHQPFNRMLVKVKKEIIAFGVEGIAPATHTAEKIAPHQLKQWLDEGRDVALLDTRNDYEVKLGTFDRARTLDIDHFREFPEAVDTLPEDWKERPVVMFCTGGIRCEKAGPLMEQRGFKQVFQLDGGILKYFDEVGGQHYQGDCFVFDQRVAVDAALRETDAAQCYACQAILLPEEQQSPLYEKSVSCPHCYQDSHQQLKATIAARHEKLRQCSTPLPGSIPYDNYRPLHVPGKFDGLLLVDYLAAAVPSVGRDRWLSEIEKCRILHNRQPLDSDHRVAAGDKYEHLFPNLVEPPVDPNIQILYEDAALVVVNKPAPLPMHAGGRFNKNTLAGLLEPVYHPERLRHAHRLDANTTGVVLFSRTRRIAGLLQPKFARGEVTKVYRALVEGHPTDDNFSCELPIAESKSIAGSRKLDDRGQPATTEFATLARYDDGTAFVEARPITGRTNQIRIHLWALDLPIVGDTTYQAGGVINADESLAPGDPPMCLHAWKIGVVHPLSGERVEYEAPLPEWCTRNGSVRG